MWKCLRNAEFRLIVSLLFIGSVLILLSYVVVNHTVSHWVEHDAEEAALEWAQAYSLRLDDLEQIARGETPSDHSQEFIRTVRSIGRVFRFKVFDTEGRLRLVSDAIDNPGGVDTNPEGATALAEHNAKAAAVVANGIPHTSVETGTPPDRPELYAETYLPVMDGDRTVAIIEVYVDQTEKAGHFTRDLAWMGVWLTGIAALAFALPYGAFLFRNRQKSKSDERLHFLAHHDPMTLVLNRSAFVEQLQAAIEEARVQGESIAVHYIDLDHFKDINDSLGHGVGDALIRAFAQRARETIRPGDLVGRFGGDEFVVAQRGITAGGQATAVADRLVAALSEPYVLDGHDLSITLSVGSAIAPRDAHTPDELLRRADLALYYVKTSGRNGFAFFRATMNEELQSRRDLEARLKRATQEESFQLHFQPVVNSDGSLVTGFEALLRLPDDGGAFVSPAEFIPLAENMGLIPRIGAWVLRKACETAMTWPEDHVVAVNLSPAQFAKDDVPGIVAGVLKDTGLPAARLELEITEGLLMKDAESVMRQLRALKQLGVSIVMDDFGTGYSSLGYLWRFPFDKIKIDRSFMQAFDGTDENVESILSTIVSLGHSLKMQVTAEGVETPEQAAFMARLDCDNIQGFLYGRPMPAGEIAADLINRLARRVQAEAELRGSGAASAKAATPAACAADGG